MQHFLTYPILGLYIRAKQKTKPKWLGFRLNRIGLRHVRSAIDFRQQYAFNRKNIRENHFFPASLKSQNLSRFYDQFFFKRPVDANRYLGNRVNVFILDIFFGNGTHILN